jgi:hypothetical protein
MITVSLSVTVFGARGALKSQFENAQIGEAPRAAGRADPGFAREARWTATSEKPCSSTGVYDILHGKYREDQIFRAIRRANAAPPRRTHGAYPPPCV